MRTGHICDLYCAEGLQESGDFIRKNGPEVEKHLSVGNPADDGRRRGAKLALKLISGF